MLNKVVIPEDLYIKAEKLGLVAPKKALPDMVRLAARVTHPLGNYRYEHIVFSLSDNRLLDINFYSSEVEPEIVCKYDDGTIEVICPTCDDDGQWCGVCNGKGLVRGSLEMIKTLVH